MHDGQHLKLVCEMNFMSCGLWADYQNALDQLHDTISQHIIHGLCLTAAASDASLHLNVQQQTTF